MSQMQVINKQKWNEVLRHLIAEYSVYAPVAYGEQQDYEIITADNIDAIVYNTPKPTTPLKSFLLPVKENLTSESSETNPVIILGIPACDLYGLNILKEIYLDEMFVDPAFKNKIDHYIFIGTDCFSTLEHCHCNSYGIPPYPGENSDMNLAVIKDNVYLTPVTDKGRKVVDDIAAVAPLNDAGEQDNKLLKEKQKSTISELEEKNRALPDYETTGQLVKDAPAEMWKKYANTCVACGACATICPTCTCFLLIDKPGFEKVRQLDACQYPGFEKVAAGEDPLHVLHKRFQNRYFCKYVWKPERFESIACTGCGRCIEACIGHINKNELFVELHNTVLSE